MSTLDLIQEAEALIQLYGDALSEFEYGLVWGIIIRDRGCGPRVLTASESQVFVDSIDAMRAVRVKALQAP